MTHESTFVHEVESAAGVSVRLRKMTFGRRLELLRRVGDLTKRAACLDAGAGDAERISAAYERQVADRAVLEWAIQEVTGLRIDGQEATPELLIECGPEEVTAEILGVVQRQLGLSDEERKN
ncbi:MAG: hypothetical protein HY820_10985 [Acidobacteria bacterium]|nr:hypothetical protein [Acidobacteriota bacterium]